MKKASARTEAFFFKLMETLNLFKLRLVLFFAKALSVRPSFACCIFAS